jgi:4-amino-4-deoxy-L-arabinose transferase and related glycosyltransferases of PMT family
MIASRRPWLVTLLVGTALAVWIFWLRAPSFGVTMWNVDETIHSAAARVLLEGGVMYRDAIDQRTPLTYYAFAAIFKVAGLNNLFAVRVVIAAMIVAIAVLLFVLGRRLRNPATGLFAAFIYAALTSYLLFPGDLYAAHTEWFVALFTTLGGVLFLTSRSLPSNRRAAAIGICFALAFLSKQPALTDLGAPLGTLLYLGLARVFPWREILRRGLALLAGFTVLTGLVVLLLVAAGAGSAFLFYAFTYNLAYYGPEVTWSARLLSPSSFFLRLAEHYPLVLVAGLASAAAIALRIAQFRPSPAIAAHRGRECYLLLWCATSLVGAMSSGRDYDHYFFQCLPPFSLMAAWLPGLLIEHLRNAERERAASSLRRALLWLATLPAAALAFNLLATPPAARRVTFPPLDPALPIAAFIREHSQPADRIFAWGYNPDIYLYADRSPASRFLYCSFQTGLIPWTNEDPSIDTAYAIVPGSMDTLLADLAKNDPAFIIDCGVGPHRRFTKYPLKNFTPLRDFVEARYVQIDPARYLPYGFRLWMRKAPPAAAPVTPSPSHATPPSVWGPSRVGTGTSLFTVAHELPSPDLTRLSLLLNDAEVAAVAFPPATSMNIQVPLTFDAPTETPHRLQALAHFSDGTHSLGAPLELTVVPLDTRAETQSAFSLPRLAGSVPAEGVRALFDPRVDIDDGRTRTFALHAPSFISYTVPPDTRAIRGRFGLPPGAYAPENPGPSDGADFIIRAVDASGTTHTLLHRTLDPARNPADRPTQSFHLSFDHLTAPLRLEFEITAGPTGNAASDWTFWSDLILETSAAQP